MDKQMVVARYPVGHKDEPIIEHRLITAGIPYKRQEYMSVGANRTYVMIVVSGDRCMEAFDLVNQED